MYHVRTCNISKHTYTILSSLVLLEYDNNRVLMGQSIDKYLPDLSVHVIHIAQADQRTLDMESDQLRETNDVITV